MHRHEQVGVALLRPRISLPQLDVVIAVARHHGRHSGLPVDLPRQAAGNGKDNGLFLGSSPSDGARVLAAVTGIDSNEHVAVRGGRDPFRNGLLLDAPGIDIDHNAMTAAILAGGDAKAGSRGGRMQVEHDAQHVAGVTPVTHPAHDPRAPLGKPGADPCGIKVHDYSRLIVQHLKLVAARLVQFKDHPRLRVVLGHADAVDARGRGIQGAGHKPGNQRNDEAVGVHACCIVRFPRWRV